MSVYNITAHGEKLHAVVTRFSLKIIEKFSIEDWNVQLDRRDEDDFTDMCEELGIKYDFVGDIQ